MNCARPDVYPLCTLPGILHVADCDNLPPPDVIA
jgi:hypothetical protein